MFCEHCGRYCTPWADRVPLYCGLCGGATVWQQRAALTAAVEQRTYLLGELNAWREAGDLSPQQADALAAPYVRDAALAARYLNDDAPQQSGDRPRPPQCHTRDAAEGNAYCPDCGTDLGAESAVYPGMSCAAAVATHDPDHRDAGDDVRSAPAAVLGDTASAPVAATVADTAGAASRGTPATSTALTKPATTAAADVAKDAANDAANDTVTDAVTDITKDVAKDTVTDAAKDIVTDAVTDVAKDTVTDAVTDIAKDAVKDTARDAAKDTAGPRKAHGARRLWRELRPVFYENLILFLGAFLVFAGSVYFAIYFWGGLGAFGPPVAGGLLAVYGFGFAGAGYLLQRRYRAALSARVLFAMTAAILPVAAALVGEPLRAGSWTAGATGALCAMAIAGLAYPATVVAAALFQREIAIPFARQYAILLLATGLAPLVVRIGGHTGAIALLYLAAIPMGVFYWRIRDVGRVFEPATAVFTICGSVYVLSAVIVRVAIALESSLAPAAVAPLAVLAAAGAVDIDVTWRQRTYAARSALGVAGLLAQAAVLLAVIVAFAHPQWRIVTNLAAGMFFAVTGLRHRRAIVMHPAVLAVVAGLLAIAWLPALAPPRAVPWSGLALLPLAAGLARLGVRWRDNGAADFARPCELWAVLLPIGAVLAALVLPLWGAPWRIAELGSWAAHGPALAVAPAAAAVLAMGWRWGRRRFYLGPAVVLAATAFLVAIHGIGASALALAASAAGWALLLGVGVGGARRGLASARSSTYSHKQTRAQGALVDALVDAAMVLVAAAGAMLLAGRLGPWTGASATASAAVLLLVAAAAVAVAAHRPQPQLGMAVVIAVAAAGAAALWPVLDHLGAHELLPGILFIGLLTLDCTRGDLFIGRSQPFAGAYTAALAALGAALGHLVWAHALDMTATPVAEPLSVGLGLLVMGARHRSPWPVYGAFASFLLAAYAAPASLGLAVPPATSVKACAAALLVLVLGLRLWPRLRPWRTVFLDVPLHLAAVAAPVYLLRLGWILVADPPADSMLLLRRAAVALITTILVTVTHGSLVHGFMAAVAFVCLAPTAVVVLGLDWAALAHALLATAIAAWAVAHVVSRSAVGATPIRRSEHSDELRGDAPLPLFGRWHLPSRSLWRDLAREPLGHVGALAAVVGFGLCLVATVTVGDPGSEAAALGYALALIYAVYRACQPGAQKPDRIERWFAHGACVALGFLAAEIAYQIMSLVAWSWQYQTYPIGLLAAANACALLAWVVPRARPLPRPRSESAADHSAPGITSWVWPDFGAHGRVWAHLACWLVAIPWAGSYALFATVHASPLGWPGIAAFTAAVLVATATHLLLVRRAIQDWLLAFVASLALASTLVASAADMALAMLLPVAVWQLGDALVRARGWLAESERNALGTVAAIGTLVLAALATVAVGPRLEVPWLAVAAALFGVALARARWRHWLRRVAVSAAVMSTAGLVLLWAAAQMGWLVPAGGVLGALALVAALGAWGHWWWGRRADFDAVALASLWALWGAILATIAAFVPGPPQMPPVAALGIGMAALMISTAWYIYAAIRAAQARYGYAALGTLVAAYVALRANPLLAGIDAQGDAIIAIATAFGFHFVAELLQRAQLTALQKSALLGARLLPAGACAVVLAAAIAGQEPFPTLGHVLLAEAIAVLYTLGHWRGGHRVLGLIATAFGNAGLALLWIYTDRTNALFYTIPTGVSVVVLARIYQDNLSPAARRGLRIAGELLIYISVYHRVMQFDSGLYALLLGVIALVGLGLGFIMALRDLFLLSAGFLVLNVVSNLTYYGVHRPLLGWTILTLTGLGLTAGGVLFQLRRDQVRSLVSQARATMRDWE